GGDRFLARQASRHRERILVRHAHDLVVDVRVENIRHEPGTDALLPMWRWLATREHCAFCRLHGDDVDVAFPLTQVATCTRDRTAGADTCDEDVDASTAVLPDLGAGRAIVHVRIRR